ncbi:MAG: PLP-dependent transferase [Gammaproteobacteria bacterium]|nr:PLP-dependent transferase [Gammaproteobacteria bacterium]
MTKQSATKHRLETRAVHSGEHVDKVTGASAPNLVMSTTFASDDPAGFSIKEFGEERPYVYTRWGNPTIDMLEGKLASLEDAEACIALASGMAATTTLLLGLLESGDHLVISDVNYPGTAEYVRESLPKFGITSTRVDTSEAQLVADAIQPNTKLIWVETPANPTLRLTDIAAVSAIAKRHGIPLAVDSTFATPIVTRPLQLGADCVVHSLSKYIGGHGDAIGGAILGSRERMNALRNDAMIHLGGVISPFNAWLIARGAATLPARMRMHTESAMALATFLESHPAVLRVNYPGLASHPQFALADRQMDLFSGMLSFQVRDGDALAYRCAKELNVFHFAVSLGHSRSLIYWIPTEAALSTGLSLDAEQTKRYREFAGDGLFRVSVGLEHPDDLCEDLAEVLGN